MTRLKGLVCRSNIALLSVAMASSPALRAHAGSGTASSGLSSIAEREIARRMARMDDARLAVEKGDKLFSDDDFEGALSQYKAALEAIPNAPATAEWRTLVETKYADACVALAQDRAKTGRYKEARDLLQEALETRPGHRGAETLKKRLDDPDRYPPALTAEHVKKVQDVERSLQKANSYQDLGEYDNAIKEFQEALRSDPYNTAARRGMEHVEQRKSQYYQSARDHQRARMIKEVDAMWEEQVPVQTIQVQQDIGSTAANGSIALITKMKTIRFPQVTFAGATIEEAVEYLRVKSRDLDNDPDPSRRGVNIILKAGDTPSTAQISLDLKDVPMEEALRYITELAGMKFKVEPYAVLVVPVTESTTEMVTRVYKVPPDFLSVTSSGGDSAAPAAAADPFAAKGAAGAGGDSSGPRLMGKKAAKDILSENGIPFPDGSSAVFNPVTSQLVVRNTAPNIDMVETYVESLGNRTPKQVYITTKFVEVTQKNTDELGFDWLLGPFNIPGSNRVFGSGGNVGNSANGAVTNADFPFSNPGTGAGSIGTNAVSRGLRFGTAAISPDSIDGLLSSNTSTSTVSPGIFALSGVLTDPQFQVVVRAIGQKKGVDLMSAPSVTTKSGVRAKIEVVREFLYPTEFDPPQIPQNFGGTGSGASLLGGGGNSSGSFPVTPTTPTAFQTKNIGVSMEVDPTVGPDGYTIDLVMSPEVTEFEGFINYGSPIQTSSTDALGNPTTIVLTENRIPQPVFSTR
ncbi:MAG: type and secretion system protein, partial [Verrucomicrobiaceae bacterium]|nr:type and secretion system protein [Verrucomicrobiaceae bacterium]